MFPKSLSERIIKNKSRIIFPHFLPFTLHQFFNSQPSNVPPFHLTFIPQILYIIISLLEILNLSLFSKSTKYERKMTISLDYPQSWGKVCDREAALHFLICISYCPHIIIWKDEKTASRVEGSSIKGAPYLRLWHCRGLGHQLDSSRKILGLWGNHKGFDLRTRRGYQVFPRVPPPRERGSGIRSSIQAKNCLDGAKLYESICKMNIYYSNFRSVDLKH